MKKSVVKLMKKADVEKSLKTMKKGVIAIRKALTGMKLGKAHEDYDYDSFKEFLNKVVIPEIDYSYDSCNDQANAGEIEYNVGGKEFIGINSYSALEPLIRAKLEPAEQKEVFQHIQEEGSFDSILDIPKKHISRKLMEDVIGELDYIEQSKKDKGSSQHEKNINSEKESSQGESKSKAELSNDLDSFCTSLIGWMELHEELDEDEILEFFECMQYKLDEEDDFEELIMDVVESTLSHVAKENLCIKLLTSIKKRRAKAVIRSFKA